MHIAGYFVYSFVLHDSCRRLFMLFGADHFFCFDDAAPFARCLLKKGF